MRESNRRELRVREGFSGASVREICQRYTVGLLIREQVSDELTRRKYEPQDPANADFFDAFVPESPSSIGELSNALMVGFLGSDTYDAVLNQICRNEQKLARRTR